MAQMRRIDCQVQVESSADKFFDAYKTKHHLMPKMSGQLITDIKLVEGDWDSVGSVRMWYYVVEGKSEFVKEKIVKMDDKNRTIVYKLLEGQCQKLYKSWNSILHVTQMGAGSLVKWTMEFEKQNDDIPDPVMYAGFFTTWIKNVDAFLIKN